MKKFFIILFIFSIFGAYYSLSPLRVEIGGEKKVFFHKQTVEDYLKTKNLIVKKQQFLFKNIEHSFVETTNLENLAEAKIDIEKITSKVFSFLIKIKSMFFITSEIPLFIGINNESLKRNIDKISSKLYVEGKPAEILTKNSIEQIFPETSALTVDKEKLYQKVRENISNNIFEVSVDIIESLPATSIKSYLENNNIKVKLAEYSTIFNPDNPNRVINLQTAADSINRILLAPGVIFSFNEFVGKRTYEAGYIDAPVIVAGKLVDGIAGGICQITSTLYNAVLLSGLEIVERHPHSIFDYEWAYTPPGLDSAVAYPYLDFKFKNNLSQKIFITVEIKGDRAVVEVFGEQKLPYEIELVSGNPVIVEFETVYKYSDKIKEGKEIIERPGVHGYIVESFRIFNNIDGTNRREFLKKDTYRKYDKIVTVGKSKL